MEQSSGSEKRSNVQDVEDPEIRIRSLWKIYGANEKRALKAYREEGVDADLLRKRYGCIIGVADMDLDVSRGEVLCVMGLSGSGKSTMVRLINRLIQPTEGSIRIGGRDVMALSGRELRNMRGQSVSMVFQHMALLPHRTVRDNVAFGLEVRKVPLKLRRDAAARALELVRLADWANQYPDELSGGMQQRVGLARALATDPEILLMDEPFSALDPLIRRSLQDEFLELSRAVKKTTIFITHDLDEAIKIGSRIAVMKEGRIVQVGRPDEIVTRPADTYVAEFVEGVSMDRRVFASAIMRPISESGRPAVVLDPDRKSLSPSDTLPKMLDALGDHEAAVAVIDKGKVVGFVAREDIVRAMRDFYRLQPNRS